jgi:thiamine transporter
MTARGAGNPAEIASADPWNLLVSTSVGKRRKRESSSVLFPRRFYSLRVFLFPRSQEVNMPVFSLFSSFAEMDLKEWLLFGILALAAAVALFLLTKRKKAPEPVAFDTRALVYGALAISLAFVLSYLKLFRMPQGGSITPGSMLPVFVYAYWYGTRKGLLVGLAYAALQMIQDAWFVHPVQILLDYILAFGLLSVAGFFKKNLYAGIAAGGILRLVCHWVSGAIFFAEYAPEGVNPWMYSLGYQASSILPDLAICLVVAVLLKKTIDRIRPARLPS